jgi:hypothetical protein
MKIARFCSVFQVKFDLTDYTSLKNQKMPAFA